MPTPPEAKDQDATLFAAHLTGDTSAFEELYDRNWRNVHDLAFRYLGNAERAEDLTQEVFLRLHRLTRYEATARFTTFLYRITVNLALNYLRNHKAELKERPLSIPGQADETTELRLEPTTSPLRRAPESPSHLLRRGELRQSVKEAIDLLPDQQRIVLILNHYQGLSYDEIAAILGQTHTSVRSLLFRARERLKQSLKSLLE